MGLMGFRSGSRTNAPAPAEAELGRFMARGRNGQGAELGRLRAGWVLGAVCLALLGCWEEPPRMLEEGDPQASVETWLEWYPEVEDHRLLARVEEVDRRMRDSVGAHAELYVLEMGRSPRAVALPGGKILLSRSGLELCYEGVSVEEGDARLAFLLGHELTHVANDDFWHASAFATVQDVEDEKEALRRLRQLLAQNDEDRQVLELKADQAGILAAIQAGYDPAPILQGNRSFFEEWTGGPDGSLAYADKSHPVPTDRAEYLRRELARVAGEIELFDQGVDAFQQAETLAAGGSGRGVLQEVKERYEEAIGHFEAFRRLFEGREVLSNLALAHLRLATQQLAGCDGTLVNRYYLPTALDPVTLAERAVQRGAGDHSSPCFDNDDYQRHIGEATRLLEKATRRDPGYLPARLNLVAAFVLDEQPAQAANLARETARRFPEDSDAAEAWSAAHLAYLETGSSFLDARQIVQQVETYRREFPQEPGIAFNLAAFESYGGRLDEARPVWREFLELEPEGPWAEIAREWVGDDALEGAQVARR